MRLLSFILSLLVFIWCTNCTERKTAQADSGLIAAGNLQVYYEQHGQGEPLLLLHAGLQNHDMWDEQVKALAGHYKVITIDLPFHGHTKGIDTAILAREVVRIVLDSLHFQKVSIAGLSMGASVAQDFVIAYPNRVNKVILMAAGINGLERKITPDSVSMRWYPRFTAALEANDTARAAREFAIAWGEGVDHQGDSLRKPASRHVYQTTLATLQKHKLQGWPNLQDEPPAVEGISSIKAPVLIIHGDKDLPFITVSSEYLEKTIPGARRVLLKGAAHMLNLEQPEAVNALLLDFLKSR